MSSLTFTHTVTERFLRYVTIDTQSDPQSPSSPSTEKQKDLGRVLVLRRPPAGIVRQAARVGEAELRGQVGHDPRRNVRWSSEEGAQVAHGGKLDGKAEPVVVAAARANELAVAIVEVEAPGALRRRWFGGSPASRP